MLSTEFGKFFWNNTKYLGCFSSDNYPKSIKIKDFFVVNKDSSNQIGSHWMAVYYNNDIVEFFDSGGTNEKTVASFLSFDNKLECVFNETSIQPPDTNTCGEFSVYFLLNRVQDCKITYKKFLNKHFNLDLNKNNEIVSSYLKTLVKDDRFY